MGFAEWLSLINLIILVVTLIILARYAYDTFRMQKATSRQVELQIKPLIAVEPIKSGREFVCKITNIGNGTALNIDFEPMPFGSDYTDLEFRIPFILSLRPGETREGKIVVIIAGKEADDSWTAHLNPDYANRVIPLNLKYNDIEFKEFNQSYEFGMGELKIKMKT